MAAFLGSLCAQASSLGVYHKWTYACTVAPGKTPSTHSLPLLCKPDDSMPPHELQLSLLTVNTPSAVFRDHQDDYSLSCDYGVPAGMLERALAFARFRARFEGATFAAFKGFDDKASSQPTYKILLNESALDFYWNGKLPQDDGENKLIFENIIDCRLSHRNKVFSSKFRDDAAFIKVDFKFLLPHDQTYQDWLKALDSQCQDSLYRSVFGELPCAAVELLNHLFIKHTWTLGRQIKQQLSSYFFGSDHERSGLDIDRILLDLLVNVTSGFYSQLIVELFYHENFGRPFLAWLKSQSQGCQDGADRFSEQECQFLNQMFKRYQDSFGLLSFDVNTQLPTDFQDALNAHARLQALVAELRSKQHSFRLNFDRLGDGGGRLRRYSMGESIQAVLVRRTLENLAPDVFLPVGGENRSGSHTLNLSIHDYFEAFSGQAPALTAPKIPTKKNSLIQHDGVQAALQMPRLKPANPFEPRHSRQDLLQAYQLSEQDMICHIYSSTIIDSIHTRWWEALIEIGCTRVLLSSAFAPGRFDWPIIKLSELLEKKPSLGEGLVIIHNDTLGRMLDLYAMSDLALVIGPINFFEPLNLGVPSLIFDDEDKEFSRLGYFELVHLALATGGALYLNNYNLLPQAAQQLLSSQPKDKILRPYQSINPRTKNSALQDYLDHLAQVLLLRLHLDHGLNFWQEGEHFVPFAPARDTPKPSVFSQ